MRNSRLGSMSLIFLLCLIRAKVPFAQERQLEKEQPFAAAVALERTLTEIVARAEPSVAAILRVRRNPSDDAAHLDSRPDPFGRRAITPLIPQPTDPDFVPSQYGAGVIVSPGRILTTADLIGEESDYYVITNERRVYKATVWAADPRSYLAVLSIDATDLPQIVFGDGARLKKGRIVIALGNPQSITRDGSPSAACGIVSNLHRKAPPTPTAFDPTGRFTLHHFGTLIQTDVKLGGNFAGGPLLDLNGEMVGLCVSFVLAPGQELHGGYAIPVDDVFRRAVETLIEGREVQYGFLGVQPSDLSEREVLAGMHGIRVAQIIPGTPAARFGIKPGDIVTAVDDLPIYDADGLIFAVSRLPPESTVRLSMFRGGKQQTIAVSLSKLAVRGPKVVSTADPPWRGLQVEYPTALVDEYGRLPGGLAVLEEAVIVAEVVEGSPAWEAGLRKGMLITHVGDTPVGTPSQFAAAAASYTGPVVLQIGGEKPGKLVVNNP